jgi:hypothetical protein
VSSVEEDGGCGEMQVCHEVSSELVDCWARHSEAEALMKKALGMGAQ